MEAVEAQQQQASWLEIIKQRALEGAEGYKELAESLGLIKTDSLEAFIAAQMKAVEAEKEQAGWLEIIKQRALDGMAGYKELAEAMGLITEANENIVLSEQQKAAIQTEFNQRYLEVVKGNYALEDAEITAALERYGQVEKDKTKLTEMENSLRENLRIQTAQTVASSFSRSMQQMAKAGMIGEKTAKKFAQLQALVDAYASANAAYKAMAGIPVIGPFLAVAAAAAAMAAGLANVQAIERAQTGFDGIVNSPTMFMTGEGNKAEHVSVTPLQGPNIKGPKGKTVNIYLDISAPLIDDTVIDHIIPAIEQAVDRGQSELVRLVDITGI